MLSAINVNVTTLKSKMLLPESLRIRNYTQDINWLRTRLALFRYSPEDILNSIPHSPILLVPALFCCSLLVSLHYIFSRKKSAATPTMNTSIASLNSLHTRNRLARSLSTFVVPTPLSKSRFPTGFLLRVIPPRDNTIQIDLALLLASLISGKLELRDQWIDNGNDKDEPGYVHPLDLLLNGTLEVNDYRIQLKVGRKIWASVSSWVLLVGYGGTSTATAETSTQFAPKPFDTPIEQFGQHIRSSIKIDLDYASYASLELILKTFVVSIPSGGQGLVEFNVLAPQVKWLSKEFVLCAISFTYSDLADDASKPTPTPLLLSLKHVIEILSSVCTSLSSDSSAPHILSCTNSSSDHASALCQTVRDGDFGERENGCEQGWNGKRSMMIWQAALLRIGWVQRWVVVVSK
ncbi:hypothetical protein F5878DRAFT_626195 [Lentinula raphanica]|uniref:Uncharacterized protein n=1 Tax=Lentinula raphanica TaxID=153919 RepID=A0AA38P4B7_9AGAR|nr:hypothetical protein F5878DRAFT_626195 [Lentinula raphanica]